MHGQVAWRPLNTASQRHFEKKVPEKQKPFEGHNGIPVHLKDGPG